MTDQPRASCWTHLGRGRSRPPQVVRAAAWSLVRRESKADPLSNGGLERGQAILIKFWLEVGDKEQKDRAEARIDDPLRQRELSPDGPRCHCAVGARRTEPDASMILSESDAVRRHSISPQNEDRDERWIENMYPLTNMLFWVGGGRWSPVYHNSKEID